MCLVAGNAAPPSEAFLTQPALSRSIQALEEELGQPLFDRVGHRSELTAFGREIVQRARQLIIDADELVACGHRMADGRAGSLRVGLGSSPAAILMTPILQLAAADESSLRVSCSLGDSEQLLRGLRSRALDALVVEIRSLKPAADLQVTSVISMKGVNSMHPLIGHSGLQHQLTAAVMSDARRLDRSLDVHALAVGFD